MAGWVGMSSFIQLNTAHSNVLTAHEYPAAQAPPLTAHAYRSSAARATRDCFLRSWNLRAQLWPRYQVPRAAVTQTCSGLHAMFHDSSEGCGALLRVFWGVLALLRSVWSVAEDLDQFLVKCFNNILI